MLHLYAVSNPTPKGALARRPSDPLCFTIEGLTVTSPYERYSFVKRWRHEIAYGRILAERLACWRPDIAISCNAPLDVQRLLLERCRRHSIPFVFWVQDLFGVASRTILRRNIPLLGDMIGRYYIAMERRIARRSRAVVIITQDFAPVLNGWGVPESRISVIENWAPLDEIFPGRRDNEWARSHGLIGKICFLYTGMIGLKHNPDLVWRLANHVRGRKDVVVVVVSEGRGADWLAKQKMEADLDNLILLGFQPYERLSEVLASGDVLFAILEQDAGIFSVPSKILSYLSAGRPVLAAVPAENLAARIISENQAGLVVNPADKEGFLRAAETLISDSALRHRLAGNAKAYAARTFDIDAIATRFERILELALV